MADDEGSGGRAGGAAPGDESRDAGERSLPPGGPSSRERRLRARAGRAGERPLRRRAFLAGAGLAVAGGAGLVARTAGPGAGRERSGGTPVSMLAAGSLHDALEHGLRPRVEADLRVEALGSAALARFVAEGRKDPDVVSVADVALFDGLLDPAWYAEFATTAVVLAYDADSPGGRRIAEAGPGAWYRPLLAGEVALGRTDPDLDPLGYRTLFALELATEHYDAGADLRAAIPAREQVYPETQLPGQLETGGIEAAFTYRSTAVSRGYDYLELPAAVDLSDPRLADRYAAATYELPGGRVVEGAPISYATTVRHRRPAVDRVVRAHVAAESLPSFGFELPDGYPRYAGDVPAGLGATTGEVRDDARPRRYVPDDGRPHRYVPDDAPPHR